MSSERDLPYRFLSPSPFFPKDLRGIKDTYEYEQRVRAQQHLSRTIFPKLLKNYALHANVRLDPLIFTEHWPEIEKRSAVLDLIWNMEFLRNYDTDSGSVDLYMGKALAIEVNPSGDLLFHSDKNPSESGLILPQLAWIGEDNIQKDYFDRAFRDSKSVNYTVELNTGNIHD